MASVGDMVDGDTSSCPSISLNNTPGTQQLQTIPQSTQDECRDEAAVDNATVEAVEYENTHTLVQITLPTTQHTTNDGNVSHQNNTLQQNVQDNVVNEHGVQDRMYENGVQNNVAENGVQDQIYENGVQHNVVNEHGVQDNVVENGVQEQRSENCVQDQRDENSVQDNVVNEHGVQDSVVENGVQDNRVLTENNPQNESQSDGVTMAQLKHLPDQNEILEKLTHIRNCKRNVLDMLDKVKTQDSKSMDKEMLDNLVQSYDGFKEQEDKFLLILERTMAIKELAGKKNDDCESLPDLESSRSSTATIARPNIEGALAADDSVESEEELVEMRALQQQRDLLRKMVDQQNKMKDIQAKRDLLINDKDGAAEAADSERRETLLRVSLERESIAAKQLELSGLKSQLEQVKQLCVNAMSSAQAQDAPIPEALRAVAVLDVHSSDSDVLDTNGTVQGTVQDRLLSLQQKKTRMDNILNKLSILSNDERSRLVETDVPSTDSAPGTDISPNEEDNPLPTTIDHVKRQLDELGSVKDKLLDLQRLSENLQEVQLQGESRGGTGEVQLSDDASINQLMRSNYEQKLEEQKRALEELQNERLRLMEVKDQLLRMQGDVQDSPPYSQDHPFNTVDNMNNAAFIPQQQPNRGDSDYRGGVSSARLCPIERPCTGLDSSVPASILMQQRRPLNSMMNVEPPSPDGSSIISNPRLASFRRNNLLERQPSGGSQNESPPSMMAPLQPSSSHSGRFRETTPSVIHSESGLRRTSSFSQYGAAPMQNQYVELQQHMNSIQNIFEQMASGSRGGSVTPTPAVTPQNDSVQQLQQQQLIMSLMTCQQQLHMQQMEMQQLQNVCQQLAANQLQASHNIDGGGAVSERGDGALPPWVMHPSQFDSRPLSSQSLYNLLAPNPYLQPNRGQSARSWQSPARSPWAKHNVAQSWHNENVAHSPYRNQPVSPVLSMSEETDASHGKPPSIPKLNLTPKSGLYGKQSNLSARSRPRTRSGDYRNLPGRAVASARAATVERDASSQESRERRASSDCSQFDSLREVIYSEVATLISQNEERPEFLLEMFRDMQLLGSDYMRTKAVQSIRGLLNKYLDAENATTNEDDDECETEDENRQSMAARNRDFASFLSTTTADITDQSCDEGRVNRHSSTSASASSTPGRTKNKAVHLGSLPSQRSKRFENIAELRGDVGLKRNESPLNCKSAVLDVKSRIAHIENRSMDANANEQMSSIDVSEVEKQIEGIVDELIPVLRHNATAACTPALLQYVRKLVMTLTASKCATSDATTDYFHRQLSTILDDTLAKYSGRRLQDCGEALLTDVSEVVFNELAFSRLMTNINSGMTNEANKKKDRGPRPPVPPKINAKKLCDSSSVVDLRKSFVPGNVKRLNQSTSAVSYKITLAQSEIQSSDEEDRNRKSSTPRLPTVPRKDVATAISGQNEIDDHIKIEVTETEVNDEVHEDIDVVNPYPKAFRAAPVCDPSPPTSSQRKFNLNGEPHPEDHNKN